jgi:hypothetical protein
MGLYRYSDENNRYENSEDKMVDDKREDRKDKGCDAESARALKKILSMIDELNDRDLRILDDVIDRLMCIRTKEFK